MNKALLMFTLAMGLFSCTTKNTQTQADLAQAVENVKDHVELVYFHGKQRCITCRAIEKYSQEVVDSLVASGISADELTFKVVDINENEAMADSYEVIGSSLYLVKFDNGQETRDDLTEFGFGNAKNKPNVFKQGLTDKIETTLK